MRTISGPLATLLYSGSAHLMVECYTVAFASGTQYWCTGDLSVVIGGNTFSPTGLAFTKGQLHTQAGATQTDTIQLSIDPGAAILYGQSMISAAMAGYFNGIAVTLQRAYLDPVTHAVVGSVIVFAGTVDDCKPGSEMIDLTVVSSVAKMNEQIPRRLLQAACPFHVYDPGCGLVAATYTSTGVPMIAGTTAAALIFGSLSANANMGGWVKLTSGNYSGQRRVIRSAVPNSPGAGQTTIYLDVALPGIPAVGNTFTVTRGCDKSRATCSGTFANILRFGGMPEAPNPEALK